MVPAAPSPRLSARSVYPPAPSAAASPSATASYARCAPPVVTKSAADSSRAAARRSIELSTVPGFARSTPSPGRSALARRACAAGFRVASGAWSPSTLSVRLPSAAIGYVAAYRLFVPPCATLSPRVSVLPCTARCSTRASLPPSAPSLLSGRFGPARSPPAALPLPPVGAELYRRPLLLRATHDPRRPLSPPMGRGLVAAARRLLSGSSPPAVREHEPQRSPPPGPIPTMASRPDVPPPPSSSLFVPSLSRCLASAQLSSRFRLYHLG